MQDHNQISKEFIDRSWGEMKVILDKELPVQSKRPTFLFWILSGIFGLILLLTAGFFYQQNKKNQENLALQKKSEYAFNKEQISADKTTKNSLNSELENDIRSENQIASIQNKLDQSNQQSTEEIINPSNESTMASISIPVDKLSAEITEEIVLSESSRELEDATALAQQNDVISRSLNVIEVADSERNSSDFSSIISNDRTNETSLVDEKESVAIRNLLNVYPLNLPFSFIHFNRTYDEAPLYVTIDDDKIEVIKPVRNAWHLGVEGAALSENMDAFNGMGFSLFADYELRDRYRFGIHLGYNLFDHNQSNNDALEDFANAGTELSSGTGSFEFAQLSYSDAAELLDKVQFLSAELRAGVQMVPRFYLETGISYSYFLDATNEESIILPASSPAADFESFAISSRTLKDNSLVNRGQWSGLLAVEWKPLDRVGLNFSYYHGLETLISRSVARSNLLNSEGDDTYNRYYKAGLKIYF